MSSRPEPTKPERNFPPARPVHAHALLQQLKKGRALLLAGRPIDGDSLGSALALRRILAGLNIEADVGSGDQIPESLQFFPDIDQVIFEPDFLKYSNVVILDCGEMSLTGFVPQIEKIMKSNVATVINVDHHIQDPPYGHFAHIDVNASATGYIVYRLAQAWNAPIDPTAAYSLLATIYFDTGSFQHSNVDAGTLRMAADCVRLGADAPDIAKKMFRSKSFNVLKLWGRALSRARYQKEEGVISSMITQEDLDELGLAPSDVGGIVDMLAHVPESEFALLLTDQGNGTIKGSLRSNESKEVNVARIANLLGGGGHKLASAFRMKGQIKEEDGVYKVV